MLPMHENNRIESDRFRESCVLTDANLRRATSAKHSIIFIKKFKNHNFVCITYYILLIFCFLQKCWLVLVIIIFLCCHSLSFKKNLKDKKINPIIIDIIMNNLRID